MNDLSSERQGERTVWVRALYMLLFVLLYGVAEFVMTAVVLVQLVYRLFNDECHPRLLGLGQSLATYIYQILRFLSFNTEMMPYPFSEWPQDSKE